MQTPYVDVVPADTHYTGRVSSAASARTRRPHAHLRADRVRHRRWARKPTRRRRSWCWRPSERSR